MISYYDEYLKYKQRYNHNQYGIGYLERCYLDYKNRKYYDIDISQKLIKKIESKMEYIKTLKNYDIYDEYKKEPTLITFLDNQELKYSCEKPYMLPTGVEELRNKMDIIYNEIIIYLQNRLKNILSILAKDNKIKFTDIRFDKSLFDMLDENDIIQFKGDKFYELQPNKDYKIIKIEKNYPNRPITIDTKQSFTESRIKSLLDDKYLKLFKDVYKIDTKTKYKITNIDENNITLDNKIVIPKKVLIKYTIFEKV